MIDYNNLFEKSKELAKQSGLTQLELYQRFMFERILERISVSKYRDNFILKGGLLLSAMLGIESRTTRDMDISVKGIDISKERMVQILNEVLSINLDDKVKFEMVNITDIRQEDEYGGNKYHLIGKLENLKVALEIDISTGDEITPKALKYEYSSLFEDKKIYIDSYNIETILAEKIETILRRGKYNARMKGKKMFKVQRSISQLNFEDDSSSKISSDSDLNNSLSKNNEFPIKKMSTKIEKKNSFNQPIMEKRRFAARNSVVIEDQRRNQILRGVINKVKKKDNESSVILNQPLETIKHRPSIFQRDLKSKIKQTTDIINEFQKFESNPNIFSENIEIEKPNVIEVEKKK